MSPAGPEALPVGSAAVPSGPAASAAPLIAAVHTPGGSVAAASATTYSPVVAIVAKDIDASTRTPVLLFFASAISWLLIGSALAALASFKLNVPDFLADVSWLTFGRVHPAAASALMYGWMIPAGVGIGLWVLARLSRTALRHGGVLTAAWGLWNVGVTLGVAAILYGQGTSYEGLEFPRYVAPVLFTAFVFIAVWVLLIFGEMHGQVAYISRWYVLAAFLWFPWVYATANLVVFFLPVQAPAQAMVAAWYAHNVVATFLVPLALGAAYYIVPKATGQTVHRYGWAKVGFWTWMFFAGWSGEYALIGGPVPAWLLSVSIAATVLLVIPLTAIFTNLHGSMRHLPGAVRHSPSFRFVAVAVPCFLASVLFLALTAFRSINEITHFTLMTAAGAQLLTYGFVSLVFFGGIYYTVPRLLGSEWESPALIRAHFWLAIVGLGLSVVVFGLGGLIQGLGLDDPKVPAVAVLSLVKPFLAAEWVALLILTAGHVCLAASFMLILARSAWGLEPVQRVAALTPRFFHRASPATSAAAPVAAASVP